MGATNPNAGGAPGGGGKGGMNQNLRGPAGNAQNNPGGPQANYGMGMNQSFPGQPTGINPGHGPSQMISTPVAPGGAPGANFQHLMQWLPKPNFGQQARPGYGGRLPDSFVNFGGGNIALDKGYFRPSNLSIPTPQPQEPIGGYIDGQPAQFHYQAEALNNPLPRRTSAGLPAGGILSKLYGG